jgi:hypothetical protein
MRDLAWFDSLLARDFENGAVISEIREVFRALSELSDIIKCSEDRKTYTILDRTFILDDMIRQLKSL